MKKRMVIFLVVIMTLSVSILAYSQSVEQIKAKMISYLDERINMLQEAKACVSAAQTPEDLKSCREKLVEKEKSSEKR